MILIELTGAPSGKGRPRFIRATGHAYTPEKTRNYESSLRLAAQDAMNGAAPLEGPLAVTVHALFPVPASWSRKKRDDALSGLLRPTTKPDADNILKVLDALNEVVFRDDKQVVDARVVKTYSARPAMRIEISEVV